MSITQQPSDWTLIFQDQSRRPAYLLSWDVLMLTSFGSPLKYEMSRAAMELETTRLLRAPHMLTTTSQDGVVW